MEPWRQNMRAVRELVALRANRKNRAHLLAAIDESERQLEHAEQSLRELQAEKEQAKRERDAWEETAAFHCRNEAFYRELIQRTGRVFGKAAFTSDDGSVQDSVLALKVPELAEALEQTVRTLTEFFRDIQSLLDGPSRPLSGAEPHIQEIVGKALALGSVPSAAPPGA